MKNSMAKRATTCLLSATISVVGLQAAVAAPASAASRDTIVSVAQAEAGKAARNKENPMGSGCNYYTGVFRTWKSASGCGSGDGVQFRNSDWCADFSKYVWKTAGVRYADVAETSGGILTGWASSFKDYGTTYGTWHARSSGYTPQPGDALVFDWDQSGDIDHVGIVTSSNASTVYTIEGNSGDAIKAHSYSRSDIDIVGYSSPVGIDGGSPNLGVLEFYLSDSQSSNVATRPVIAYGNSPMVPIRGDWDGDGKDTVSSFDPTTATFYLSNTPETGAASYTFRYGDAGAAPLVGDWDGDGKDNVGVRMGNTFYMRTSPVTSGTETTTSVAYGDADMVPLVGDWDGDGKDTVSAYSATNATFYLSNTPQTGAAAYTFRYGDAGAAPLVGDWDGDGKDNVGVRMNGTFYMRTSPVTSATETTTSIGYGDPSDLPLIGDWDGNHIDSQGIVR